MPASASGQVAYQQPSSFDAGIGIWPSCLPATKLLRCQHRHLAKLPTSNQAPSMPASASGQLADESIRSTSTLASLKQAPPPTLSTLGGQSVVAVRRFPEDRIQAPFGMLTTPTRVLSPTRA